jgi:methylglyoxal synthase
MAESKDAIGMLASESCVSMHPAAKRWFHLLKFASAYRRLLAEYDIYATDTTERMLREFLRKKKDSASRRICERLHPVGPDFRGVVKLAAMVATGCLDRVLMFQDPADMGIERPGNYALLRNCNLSGKKLYINSTAHLWALHECKQRKIQRRMPYIVRPVVTPDGIIKETVVFIAHDREKPRMARFVVHYREVLRLFPRLIATSGTKKFIDEFQVEHVPPWERLDIKAAGANERSAHGPAGGDVIIADEVFSTYSRLLEAKYRDPKLRYYSFYNLLFFVDHRSAHPHEPDIQVLLKTCVNPVNQVNLLLNSRMAEEWADRYPREPSSSNQNPALGGYGHR